MIRKLSLAAVTAAAIAALTAATTGWAADKPVFGLVMSFSGWFAPIDADTIAGAKLAVAEINAAGGVLGQPIEVVEFDNKSEPPLGADGAVDLIGKGAKAILFHLNHGDETVTVPIHPCKIVRSGTVGPLRAPYKVCSISTAEGHIVGYDAMNGKHGVTYTDRGPETFLDQCYQHLTGRWWSWEAADLDNPAEPCSGPWHFHGGP